MKHKLEHTRIKLKPKTRTMLNEWLFIIVAITSMMYLYYFFSWWALTDYLAPNIFDEYMDSGYAYLEILLQGILFGIMFVILLINLLLQINRKFGYGVLFHMLTGKYHKPRKEQRIFMFLDMKDSTGNAERLGHYKYSRLIQSCIYDLTDLIIRYKAHVYQYVGDDRDT